MVDPIESLLPQDCSHVSLRQTEGACDRRLFFLGLPSIHSPLLLQHSKCNRVSFEWETKCWGLFRWGFDEKLSQNWNASSMVFHQNTICDNYKVKWGVNSRSDSWNIIFPNMHLCIWTEFSLGMLVSHKANETNNVLLPNLMTESHTCTWKISSVGKD